MLKQWMMMKRKKEQGEKMTDEELQKRRQNWTQPKLKFERGVLYKYARTVSSASKGCVTDEF